MLDEMQWSEVKYSSKGISAVVQFCTTVRKIINTLIQIK